MVVTLLNLSLKEMKKRKFQNLGLGSGLFLAQTELFLARAELFLAQTELILAQTELFLTQTELRLGFSSSKYRPTDQDFQKILYAILLIKFTPPDL